MTTKTQGKIKAKPATKEVEVRRGRVPLGLIPITFRLKPEVHALFMSHVEKTGATQIDLIETLITNYINNVTVKK